MMFCAVLAHNVNEALLQVAAAEDGCLVHVPALIAKFGNQPAGLGVISIQFL